MAAVVLPDRDLLDLPVSAFGTRLVLELRQQEFLAVEGTEFTHIGTVEDFSREGDHEIALTLAVEAFVRKDHRIAIRVGQFGLADELQVRTVDGDLLTALDGLAGLQGITGDAGGTQGQRQTGIGFAFLGDDLDHTTLGGDAGRSDDADHLVADDLEVRDADTVRELDRAGGRETVAVDGHRLAGDHLGREEHLDAEPGLLRLLEGIHQKVTG